MEWSVIRATYGFLMNPALSHVELRRGEHPVQVHEARRRHGCRCSTRRSRPRGRSARSPCRTPSPARSCRPRKITGTPALRWPRMWSISMRTAGCARAAAAGCCFEELWTLNTHTSLAGGDVAQPDHRVRPGRADAPARRRPRPSMNSHWLLSHMTLCQTQPAGAGCWPGRSRSGCRWRGRAGVLVDLDLLEADDPGVELHGAGWRSTPSGSGPARSCGRRRPASVCWLPRTLKVVRPPCGRRLALGATRAGGRPHARRGAAVGRSPRAELAALVVAPALHARPADGRRRRRAPARVEVGPGAAAGDARPGSARPALVPVAELAVAVAAPAQAGPRRRGRRRRRHRGRPRSRSGRRPPWSARSARASGAVAELALVVEAPARIAWPAGSRPHVDDQLVSRAARLAVRRHGGRAAASEVVAAGAELPEVVQPPAPGAAVRPDPQVCQPPAVTGLPVARRADPQRREPVWRRCRCRAGRGCSRPSSTERRWCAPRRCAASSWRPAPSRTRCRPGAATTVWPSLPMPSWPRLFMPQQ